MADGMNDVRALRVAEIVQDFRQLQHYIAQIRTTPTAEEYYGEGYVLLRECTSQGRAVLDAPFSTSPHPPGGDPEEEKEHLRYVTLDASARRFQAQGIYLRATAAMRWINSRNAAQGQAQLSQIDQILRNELASITDEYVVSSLLSTDQQQGKWVEEDPTLSQIRHWLASRR